MKRKKILKLSAVKQHLKEFKNQQQVAEAIKAFLSKERCITVDSAGISQIPGRERSDFVNALNYLLEEKQKKDLHKKEHKKSHKKGSNKNRHKQHHTSYHYQDSSCEDMQEIDQVYPVKIYHEPEVNDIIDSLSERFKCINASDFNQYPLDDSGNAKYTEDILNGIIVFVSSVPYYYNGVRWKEDRVGTTVFRLVEKCIIKRRNAFGLQDETYCDNDFRPPSYSSTIAKVNSVIKSLMGRLSEPESWINKLDSVPYLLNFTNGTVDLRTGVLHPHSPTDLCSKLILFDYDEGATCPRFMRFLSELFPGQNDIANFFQVFGGYLLTGETSEQVFPILLGSGGNGKSVFVETLHFAMNDYSFSLPASSFVKAPISPTSPSSDLASLRGVRFVSCSEWSDGEVLNEAKIKLLTGSTTISARQPYGTQFEYTPKFTVVLDTNNLPQIIGIDTGIWRRLKVISFNRTFTKDKNCDRTLPQKLRLETPGILSFLVRGAQKYYDLGKLEWPDSIKKESKEYRHSQDSIGAFIEDALIESSNDSEQSSNLFSAYEQYCEENGIARVSLTTFGRRIKEKGIAHSKEGGCIFYHGYQIRKHYRQRGSE